MEDKILFFNIVPSVLFKTNKQKKPLQTVWLDMYISSMINVQ